MKTVDLAVLCIFLGVNAIWDIRKREILLIPTLLYGFVLLWQFLISAQSPVLLLVSCIPGVFLLGIALVTHGKIGLGDVWILLVLGIRLGLFLTLGVLWLALMLICLCFSFFWLLKKNDGKQTELPLVPFLFAAVLIWLL